MLGIFEDPKTKFFKKIVNEEKVTNCDDLLNKVTDDNVMVKNSIVLDEEGLCTSSIIMSMIDGDYYVIIHYYCPDDDSYECYKVSDPKSYEKLILKL